MQEEEYTGERTGMSETVIQVSHVSKLYKLYDRSMDRLKESLGLSKGKHREHYALKDLSFEVRKGECVGMIGINGAGKSTILKIITGVLTPTEGTVRIQGRISALLELGAGFNIEYTGLQNVYLNGTMNGFSKEEIDSRLETIIAFADIGEFVHQPVKTYSSGMFVRLAFAIAINIEPEILIVDEALSVGDVFFQAKCYKKFEEFKQMGKTILFVSHDLGSISKYCNRVILLDKGRSLAEGDAKTIVNLYKQVLVGQAGLGVSRRGTDRTDRTAGVDSDEDLDGGLWKEQYELNPNTLEYGEKQAEIVDFAIVDEMGRYTNAIEKGSRFSVKMKVRFHESVQDPILALSIKNLQGTEICGTNTMYEKVPVCHTQAGTFKTATFTQNMDLQGGEYLISLGCTGYRGGKFVVYHRLYDICNISVISQKNTVGFYDMNSYITVE